MITGHEMWDYAKANNILIPYLYQGTTKFGTVGVYTGFQEIKGHRAPTKVGRTVSSKALQRGRAQGGANWWFASFFLLPTNATTQLVEDEWKKQLGSQRIEKTDQRQQELYYLDPWDAANELEGVIRSCGIEVRDLVEELL